MQGTSCHCEFNVYYDVDNAKEVNQVKRLVSAAGDAVAGMGGFFSRPYSTWKDIAYKNATGTAAMQRKIKEIFDPNSILNPGKLCF